MTKSYSGYLEIDHDRGVIYFHLNNEDDAQRLGGPTLLRICQIPKPILKDKQIDITIKDCVINKRV